MFPGLRTLFGRRRDPAPPAPAPDGTGQEAPRPPRPYPEIRARLAEAPYDLGLYEALLKQASGSTAVSLARFDATEQAQDGRARLFVRHDIDTAACMANMPATLDVDAAVGLCSGVYLRVDDEEYHAGDLRSAAEHYRGRGLEFGLHTLCYLDDDALGRFRTETEKFADELGFRPRSFTVHGLGAFRYPVRAAFQAEIVGRLGDFGYELTDCEGSPRAYSYVIEDCHWDAQRQCRFIYDDFAALPPVFMPGCDYLVLTHPCYWRSEPGRA